MCGGSWFTQIVDHAVEESRKKDHKRKKNRKLVLEDNLRMTRTCRLASACPVKWRGDHRFSAAIRAIWVTFQFGRLNTTTDGARVGVSLRLQSTRTSKNEEHFTDECEHDEKNSIQVKTRSNLKTFKVNSIGCTWRNGRIKPPARCEVAIEREAGEIINRENVRRMKWSERLHMKSGNCVTADVCFSYFPFHCDGGRSVGGTGRGVGA